MVSKNPNPPEGLYLDPDEMALPRLVPFATAATTTAASTTTSSAEDLSKKIRKPYTITKSRESWTEPEHDKFLEALQLFDRDWKKIEAFIRSKTVIQIRSHAQKYFPKVQKNGTSEHLPPPRPKRKASHPYPQKASKNALALPQVSGSCQSSSALLESGFIQRPDSASVLISPRAGGVVPSWPNGSVQTANPSHENKGPTRPSCHSAEILPDFCQVYGFIGSVFDPNTSGHLQTLKKMDPIDVETVLLLMRNLSMNLTSPDFEDHRKLLSSYKIDGDTTDHLDVSKSLHTDQHKSVA
ncbi:hypothetical protein ACLB2K_071025 [Fragaria x ananassa]